MDHAERQLTVLRASELIGRSDLAPRTFDAAHWKAIHRQIFQDVYEWAGEFRTVNISKNELIDGPDGKLKQQSNPFAHVDHLESDVDELMSQIRRTDMFAGRDAAAPSTGWPTP